MATKAYKPDAKFMQYSKKMASRVTLFWMLYRLANLIVGIFKPEIASALVDLSAGVDTIMIVNMSAYTMNSSTEKVAIAFGKRKSLYSSDNEDDEEEDNNG